MITPPVTISGQSKTQSLEETIRHIYRYPDNEKTIRSAVANKPGLTDLSDLLLWAKEAHEEFRDVQLQLNKALAAQQKLMDAIMEKLLEKGLVENLCGRGYGLLVKGVG